MLRTDAAIARLSHLTCVAAGIKSPSTGNPPTAAELQPWMDEPEVTLEEAMRKW